MRASYVVIGVVAAVGAVAAKQTLTPKVTPKPASQAVEGEAPVSIKSVTPQSVVAGTRFSVTVQVSSSFSGLVTIVVRRKSPSYEQYRSVPLGLGNPGY